jgi:hypothetical protein
MDTTKRLEDHTLDSQIVLNGVKGAVFSVGARKAVPGAHQ